MSTAAFKFIPAALLVQVSFREARFPEAYGRLIVLADAGHAPSAELAL